MERRKREHLVPKHEEPKSEPSPETGRPERAESEHAPEQGERDERRKRIEREDRERVLEIQESFREDEGEVTAEEEPGPTEDEVSPDAKRKADAIERVLGVPFDRQKVEKVLENSKTLDPLRYFLRAKEYTGSFWKAFKMTFTTGGFRDANRDAVFTNRLNNLAPGETRLHETLHAASEGEDAPRGTDVFGAERAVSGVEEVGEDGKIRLTSLNEGITQYFTLQAREELKMRGPKALGAYVREIAAVRQLVETLDAAGLDGGKVVAEAYVDGNADGIREALDSVGGPGTFDVLTDSMDSGDFKGAKRLLSTFEEAS